MDRRKLLPAPGVVATGAGRAAPALAQGAPQWRLTSSFPPVPDRRDRGPGPWPPLQPVPAGVLIACPEVATAFRDVEQEIGPDTFERDAPTAPPGGRATSGRVQ